MIIFANDLQKELLKSKDNKVLIATSIGSGKTYALYLKALMLLEEHNNFVGFCRASYPQVSCSYYEFKDKFKKYKNLRFSDSSLIVENKKTNSKIKFVTQDYCYGFEVVLIDCFNHLKNLEYFKQVKQIYANCNACDFKDEFKNLFDSFVTGYGICDEIKENIPSYITTVNNLKKEDTERLLMQTPKQFIEKVSKETNLSESKSIREYYTVPISDQTIEKLIRENKIHYNQDKLRILSDISDLFQLDYSMGGGVARGYDSITFPFVIKEGESGLHHKKVNMLINEINGTLGTSFTIQDLFGKSKLEKYKATKPW